MGVQKRLPAVWLLYRIGIIFVQNVVYEQLRNETYMFL